MSANNSKRMLIGLGIALAVVVVLVLVLTAGWSDARKSALRSQLASLATSVWTADEATWRRLEATNRWRLLSPEQTDWLTGRARQRHELDAGPAGWTADGRWVDPWGNRFRIAVRLEGSERGCLIWSAGRDGRDGTADDVLGGTEPALPGELRE